MTRKCFDCDDGASPCHMNCGPAAGEQPMPAKPSYAIRSMTYLGNDQIRVKFRKGPMVEMTVKGVVQVKPYAETPTVNFWYAGTCYQIPAVGIAEVTTWKEVKEWQVRVIRDSDEEYADIHVYADTSEEAQSIAITEARVREDQYFGSRPAPRFYVDPSMDPEEVPEEGFA